MAGERDPLIDLAAQVADGGAVDWGSARSSAGSAAESAAVGELEVIAAIAQVHRALAASTETAPRKPDLRDPNARRWGPLVVLEPLGSGAFGDVFRAWDTSLDREVALKLLRRRGADAAADSVAREGQLLARVHHANVMTIYGALAIDGQVGIWGELLHGRTLARSVADAGPFSADEALVFADAICRALAAVHRAGLLHRDVKAQNVIREQGGRIVLMDLGLGRDVNTAAESDFDLAGTPLYMAPELFTGARASAQSDLYSLGVLMFFLVTGAFPVTGRSLDEIRAAHAAGRRQRLQDLRPDLPAPFVHIVECALEPDLARRFESAGAMQAAITGATRLHAPESGDAAKMRTRVRGLSGAAALAAIAAIAFGWLWVTSGRRAEGRSSVMFAIPPPPGTHLSDPAWNVGTISPDGRYVAVLAGDDKTTRTEVWLHDIRAMSAVRVPESNGSIGVFWAPDSGAIGFFTRDGLRRISVGGVRSETIAAASESRGATWSQDGTILFAPGPRGPLMRVSAAATGVKPAIVIAPDAARRELGYMWPSFLPDGQRFIYFVASNDRNVRGIYLGSLDGRVGTRLVASEASGVFAAGFLLFVRGGNLAAQRFDVTTGAVEGQPTTLMARVGVTYDYQSMVSVSADGTLVYSPAVFTHLNWHARSGKLLGAAGVQEGRYRSPALSLDGHYLAAQRYRDDTVSEIPVFDLLIGGTTTTISRGTTTDRALTPDIQFPVWGPAPADRLVYASSETGWMDIYERDIGPSETPSLLLRSESDKMPTDWSRDGRFVLYQDLPRGGSYGVWVLPLFGDRRPFPIATGPADEGEAKFSPDGKRVAYVSTESGRPEIWVRSFPDGGHETKVSVGGGLDPAWPSESELSFLDLSGRLVIANVSSNAGSRAAPPVPAFQTRIQAPGASRNNYAWDDSGKRVLINEPAADASTPQVIAVTNWTVRLPVQ